MRNRKAHPLLVVAALIASACLSGCGFSDVCTDYAGTMKRMLDNPNNVGVEYEQYVRADPTLDADEQLVRLRNLESARAATDRVLGIDPTPPAPTPLE